MVDVTRGDVVLVNLPGEYGKRRPVIVVQADMFSEFDSVLVCPITTADAPHAVTRVAISPTPENGLSTAGYVMADKLSALPRSRIFRPLGRVGAETLAGLDLSFAALLGLA